MSRTTKKPVFPNKARRAARLRVLVESTPPGTELAQEDLAELLTLARLPAGYAVAACVTGVGPTGRQGVELLDRDGQISDGMCMVGSLVVTGCPARHQVDALGGWGDGGGARQIPSAERHAPDDHVRLILAVRRLGGPNGQAVTASRLNREAGISPEVFRRAAAELVEQGMAEIVEIPTGNTGRARGIRLFSAVAARGVTGQSADLPTSRRAFGLGYNCDE